MAEAQTFRKESEMRPLPASCWQSSWAVNEGYAHKMGEEPREEFWWAGHARAGGEMWGATWGADRRLVAGCGMQKRVHARCTAAWAGWTGRLHGLAAWAAWAATGPSTGRLAPPSLSNPEALRTLPLF